MHHGAHCTLGGLVGGAGADSVARADTEITSAFRIAHSRHRRRREMLAQTTPAPGQTSRLRRGPRRRRPPHPLAAQGAASFEADGSGRHDGTDRP